MTRNINDAACLSVKDSDDNGKLPAPAIPDTFASLAELESFVRIFCDRYIAYATRRPGLNSYNRNGTPRKPTHKAIQLGVCEYAKSGGYDLTYGRNSTPAQRVVGMGVVAYCWWLRTALRNCDPDFVGVSTFKEAMRISLVKHFHSNNSNREAVQTLWRLVESAPVAPGRVYTLMPPKVKSKMKRGLSGRQEQRVSAPPVAVESAGRLRLRLRARC